jgi:hypothetical protein
VSSDDTAGRLDLFEPVDEGQWRSVCIYTRLSILAALATSWIGAAQTAQWLADEAN